MVSKYENSMSEVEKLGLSVTLFVKWSIITKTCLYFMLLFIVFIPFKLQKQMFLFLDVKLLIQYSY